MEILEQLKTKIDYLGHSDAGEILAHAAWAACDHRGIPGPSILRASTVLDARNNELLRDLHMITAMPDYSNADQAQMLRWLHEREFSGYVAKQVKRAKNKLVDWA